MLPTVSPDRINCSPIDPLSMRVATTIAATTATEPQSSLTCLLSFVLNRFPFYRKNRPGPQRPSLFQFCLLRFLQGYFICTHAPFWIWIIISSETVSPSWLVAEYL